MKLTAYLLACATAALIGGIIADRALERLEQQYHQRLGH